jgi:predicted nucleic acid-binding protein
MAVALLDTNVLFASASARDEYHDPALEIVRAVDHGDLPDGIVTNYILAETLNLVRERLGPGPATEMLDRLVEGAHFDISHAPRADFTAGQALFRQYDDLSFVDATIAADMQREGIEYLYSFDDGFDGVEGVTRLETADNPFD